MPRTSKGTRDSSMDQKHTLVGEHFFRMMMHLEDERRRCLVRGDLWGSRGDGGTSNIVSLERYRREEQRVQRPADKPTKPAA
jgi:hypothetical protein